MADRVELLFEGLFPRTAYESRPEGMRARSQAISMRARAAEFGPKALTDQELLAVFLANDDHHASALLSRFGSLRGVFSASVVELSDLSRRLQSRGKSGLNSASLLKLRVTKEINRRVLLKQVSGRALISSSRILHAYLKVQLADEPREMFRVIFLDSGLKLIADEEMGEGSINRVSVYSREVLRRALELSADSLLLVHNHPGGSKNVSQQDRQITEEIINAAAVLHIRVHDHLIVAGNAVLSMRNLEAAHFR